MDFNTMIELIGSFGFPIACVVVLFKQNADFQKTLQTLSETLKEMSIRLEDISRKVSVTQDDA